jgi:hypothetical protein
MLIYLLNICTLLVAFMMFAFLYSKLKPKAKAIRIPKNHNDTSEARYAVNERGFLEEIHQNEISSDLQ